MIINTQPALMELELVAGFTKLLLTHNSPADNDVASVGVWYGPTGNPKVSSVSPYSLGFNSRLLTGLTEETEYELDIGFIDLFVSGDTALIDAQGAGLVTLKSTIATTATPASITTITPAPIAVGTSVPVSMAIAGNSNMNITIQVEDITALGTWTTIYTGIYESNILTIIPAGTYNFRITSTVSFQGLGVDTSAPVVFLGSVIVASTGIDPIEIDLDAINAAVAALEADTESILEDVIWNTALHTEKVTDIGINYADIRTAELTQVAETTARIEEGNQLAASVATETARIDAEITRVDAIDIDLNGKTTAISSLEGKVNDPINNGSAMYNFTQTAQATANNAQSGVNNLGNTVYNGVSGLAVTNNIAQAAATSTELATAVTTIESSIGGLEDMTSVSSALVLAVNKNKDDHQATFSLAADVNGRIVGVKGGIDSNDSTLDFYGNNVRFLDSSGATSIYFDALNGYYVFKGHLVAESGTFEGDLVAAGGTFSGDLSAAGGTFSGALSAASGTFAGLVTGGSISIGNNAFKVTTAGAVDIGSGTTSISPQGFITTNGININGRLTIANIDVIGPQSRGALHIPTGSIWGATSNGTGYAFYAQTGAIGPFTGAHDGLLLKTDTLPVQGDILCDTGVLNIKDISNTICSITPSIASNDKSAVGIFVKHSVVGEDGLPTALLDDTLKSDYYAVIMNSLGEGMMNVCGEGGNISIGDCITSSNTLGKGMKQSDDIIRNYTVATSRQNVTFTSPSEIKQIACIYRCG